MAKTYTATIQARCFKEHTCVGCGAVYTYELYRKITGTAGNAQKAQENAAKNAARAMEREVDPEPCPTCGLVQPDMVGQRRAKRLRPLFWCALIAFVVVLILRVSFAVQGNVAVWVATAACAVAALLIWRVDLENPNRDPEGNRAKATERVTSGKVMHRPGRVGAGAGGAAAMTRFPRSPIHMLALLMTLAAIGMAASPELLRSSKGWPLNSETYPPVAGPGDQVRVYMNDKITSVKGYWKGDARAMIRDGEAGKPYTVSAKTNQNDWGSSISAKSSEKDTSSTPWVEVPIPNEPALAGKTVACDVLLRVIYPHLTGGSTFVSTPAQMERKLSVRLAPAASAGASYNDWWWAGSVGGMGLLLIGCTMLSGAAKSLARKAAPTRCLYPTEPTQVAQVMPPGGVAVPPPLPQQ
jgi:hypothetical protein